jgi:hypothetical protein
MRATLAISLVVALALTGSSGWQTARADVMNQSEKIVSPDQLSRDIAVRDVRSSGDTVTGTVVNQSGKTIRDVRLVVSHQWLWNDEFHPGTDDPSRAEYITLREEIPPGGQAQFTYRPSDTPTARRDGQFQYNVRVAGATEVTPGTPSSPTAGTGARPIEPATE